MQCKKDGEFQNIEEVFIAFLVDKKSGGFQIFASIIKSVRHCAPCVAWQSNPQSTLNLIVQEIASPDTYPEKQ